MRQLKDGGTRQQANGRSESVPVPGKRTLSEQLQPAPALADVARNASGRVPHQAAMETAFGTSFGGVGVEAGTMEARAALAQKNANAAAIDNKILFAEEHPSQELVGHELAHTIQQGATEGGSPRTGEVDAEQEAARAGQAAAQGQRVEVRGQAPSGAPQFNLIDEARSQHEKRGENPAAPPGGTVPHSFSDMPEGDAGPTFHHDHGFLDDGNGNIDPSKRRDPTWDDRFERLKWIAKLEAAELLRPDLVDGTSAYRHFLFGNGATRNIHYERFIANDNAGQRVLASAMEDSRDAAIRRHDQDITGTTVAPGTRSYHIRTAIIPVGSGADARYPYPTTENWQKAIGAHSIWIDANVTIEVRAPAGTLPDTSPAGSYERHLHIEMTIHAEDMYNFNPGAADIATGTPDASNGRFEVTGLGHEYLNQGTYARSFDVTTTMAPAPAPGSGASGPAVQLGRAPLEGNAEGSRGRVAER